jgi:hypothetical protein
MDYSEILKKDVIVRRHKHRNKTLLSTYTGMIFSINGAYAGNAGTGRYLEIYPNIPSITAPYMITTNCVITAISLGAANNSTGTVGIYKTTNLNNPLASISLSNQTLNYVLNQNISLYALDKIAYKVSSGTFNKPFVTVYVTR